MIKMEMLTFWYILPCLYPSTFSHPMQLFVVCFQGQPFEVFFSNFLHVLIASVGNHVDVSSNHILLNIVLKIL
jgi:hypothetical protein